MAQTGHADFSRPAVIFARQILGIRAAIELTADNAPHKPGWKWKLVTYHAGTSAVLQTNGKDDNRVTNFLRSIMRCTPREVHQEQPANKNRLTSIKAGTETAVATSFVATSGLAA